MSLDALVGKARALHERLMTDTCTVTRVTASTFNTTTGNYSTSSATLYSGVCRVKGPPAGDANPQEAEAADAEQIRTRQTVVLPHGEAATVRKGDVVTVTGGDLTGQTYTVLGVSDSTTMSARSLLVERIET